MLVAVLRVAKGCFESKEGLLHRTLTSHLQSHWLSGLCSESLWPRERLRGVGRRRPGGRGWPQRAAGIGSCRVGVLLSADPLAESLWRNFTMWT